MMKLHFLALGLLLSLELLSQTAPDKYWIQFTDKTNSPYSLSSPSEFLSQQSIDKRIKFDIGFDSLDIPVDPIYIEEVLNLGNIVLVNQSRWFNAITIEIQDSLILDDILSLDFVQQLRNVVMYPTKPEVEYSERSLIAHPQNKYQYGKSWEQTEMIGLNLLHELGYYGKDMEIAVMDAGFSRTKILPVFKRLVAEDRIKYTRDFAFIWANDVFQFSSHGTSVLSIMAAYQPDSMIGSAFMANYHLFRTEDTFYENIIEEDNWVAAAEYADYLGIDVLNTSLGYRAFDDSTANYTYEELDGNTSRITIATNIAASKGLIPVCSAGNEGDDPWHYITPPADCTDCLAIGAVDSNKIHAPFSSYGPTFDNRIKPDIVSMGSASAYAAQDSTILRGNGTSFASPLIAGAIACLWEAHPDKNNFEIMEAVRQSASLYNNPNDSLGYGIPNFWTAHRILLNQELEYYPFELKVYPNPFTDHLNIEFYKMKDQDFSFYIYNTLGELLYEGSNYFSHDGVNLRSINVEIQSIPAGYYLLKVVVGDQVVTKTVLKSE